MNSYMIKKDYNLLLHFPLSNSVLIDYVHAHLLSSDKLISKLQVNNC